MVNEPLNIKFTLDGLNCVLKLLGEQPNSTGTYPLFVELQQQGKTEVERIQKASPVAPDKTPHAPTETAP